MRITRLRLTNFRQHEATELEFGAGLTGIVGPNGAGKTTILEAIAWAMYGMPAARGSRDSIRRRNAPPRARVEVELEFTLGAHQYRIVRGLNHAELHQDGDPAPVANSLGSVTERVTRLLGMSRDEFFNTYFTGQKELAVMAAMSAPERAQFLSRVLGYERLRGAQDRLKEKRSTLRARLEGLRAGLGDPGEIDAMEARAHDRVTAATAAEAAAAEAFGHAEAVLAEVRPRWEQLQARRESALALEAELRVAGHECGAATERAERLERQVAEAAGATSRLQELAVELAPLAGLRQEAAALEELAEARARRQGLTSQLADVRNHLGSVEERLARVPAGPALDAVRAHANDVRATITTLTLDAETARTAWVRDAQDARTKRQGLLDQYAELKEQRQRLVKAGPEGNCPTCTRPLGAEYEKVLGLLDRQIEEVVSNGNYYKQRIEQLQQEPADLDELERRRVEAERIQSDVTAELGRLEAQALGVGDRPDGQDAIQPRVARISRLEPRRRAEVVLRRIDGFTVLGGQAEAITDSLKADYAAQGVEVLMLNSNLKDSREAIQAWADSWKERLKSRTTK
jgi:exonuclease SbcC